MDKHTAQHSARDPKLLAHPARLICGRVERIKGGFIEIYTPSSLYVKAYWKKETNVLEYMT